MTLRDALATALTNQYAEIWTDGGPWLTTAKTAGLLADHALADPAFRAALTESIAEAMASEDWSATGWSTADGWDDLAAAVVARMLPSGSAEPVGDEK